MTNNDVIVLDSILEQKRESLARNFSQDEYFELFTFEQSLKDYDLSYDELLSGSVDGGNDGGIDGFFIFVNDEIIDEESDFPDIRKNPRLEIYLIQSKTSSTFQERALDKIISTAHDIFNLEKKLNDIQTIYNPTLIEKVELFRKTYINLAQKHPSVKVTYIYASKGNSSSIHPKIKIQSEKFSYIVKDYLFSSTVESKFLGARELLEASRQEKSYSLQLRFLENYISRGEDNYIILANLKEYYNFIVDETGGLRKYLFESNVRDYQGNVEVNRDIRNTLSSEKTNIDFWWLNNGITILASRASVAGKTITLDDVQIVNGLQTTHTIHEHMKGKITDESSLVKTQDERAILIKIIVTNESAARDRIIKATNFQTPVPAASLRATEPIQRDIEDYFFQHGWFYDRRKNYYKNMGKSADRIISIPYLAQAVISIIYREPHNAKARPTSIVKASNNYQRIFNPSTNLQLYLFCAQLMKFIETYIRSSEFSNLRTNNQSELLRPKIIRSLIFHIAMLLTAFLTKKIQYNTKNIESLVEKDKDWKNHEYLSQIILEIVKLTNNYLTENSSTSLNTAAKRSDFTNYLLDGITILDS